jgi:hypothetical protein
MIVSSRGGSGDHFARPLFPAREAAEKREQ